MEVISIKKRSGQSGIVYAITAMGLQGGENKRLIPHPMGLDAAIFETLEQAIQAAHQAGYDAECEGDFYPRHIKGSATLNKNQPKNITIDKLLSAALPELKKQLMDKSPGVVASAAMALGEIADDSAITGLINCFAQEDANIRKMAAEALAKIGEPAVKSLIKALSDSHWLVKHSACLSVIAITGRMPSLLPELLPAVLPLLKDENWLVRSQAAHVFAEVAKYQKNPIEKYAV